MSDTKEKVEQEAVTQEVTEAAVETKAEVEESQPQESQPEPEQTKAKEAPAKPAAKIVGNIIEALEKEQMQGKEIPDFAAGDTVAVQVKVKEGTSERLQTYEGVVIGIRNRGLNSAFTVRKISSGEGVERTFQTYSSQIASIKVKRRGDVRRAKLYYLRDLSGKKARIKEKIKSKK